MVVLRDILQSFTLGRYGGYAQYFLRNGVEGHDLTVFVEHHGPLATLAYDGIAPFPFVAKFVFEEVDLLLRFIDALLEVGVVETFDLAQAGQFVFIDRDLLVSQEFAFDGVDCLFRETDLKEFLFQTGEE